MIRHGERRVQTPTGRLWFFQRIRDPDSRLSPLIQNLLLLTKSLAPGFALTVLFAVVAALVGVRLVGPESLRTLHAANMVVADKRAFVAGVGQAQLKKLDSAVRMLSDALAAPVDDQLLAMTSHAFSIDKNTVEHRRARALLDLAERLAFQTDDERGRLISRLVVAAEVFKSEQWAVHLTTLGEMTDAQRALLLADNGRLFKDVAAMLPKVRQAETDAESVRNQLAAREASIRQKIVEARQAFSRYDPALIGCLDAALASRVPGTNEFHRCLVAYVVDPTRRR